jgi:hypothetical protein
VLLRLELRSLAGRSSTLGPSSQLFLALVVLGIES